MSRVPDPACRLRWRCALLPLLAGLATCASFTHADEFAISEPVVDGRLCAVCASRPDLRHPPCSSGVEGSDAEEVVVFAMRALDLGVRASGWQVGYAVGFDRDCSDRPDGLPTSCTPRSTTGWVSLDEGIDNALATRVFYPLLEATGEDVQAEVNQSLEAGSGSLLLIVAGWNGEPDDSQVGVRLVSGTHVVNEDGRTVPSWGGDDEWEVFADRWDPEFPAGTVPDASAKSRNAHVTNGVLVWDARDIQPFKAQMAVGEASVDMDLSSVVVFGELATYERPRLLLNAVLGGVWSAFLASRNADAIAQVASRCDMCKAKTAASEIEKLLASAPDMLMPTSKPPSVCDAISVGFLGSYVEARRVARIVPLGDIPPSCSNALPCTTR